jgi:hypothetical protein
VIKRPFFAFLGFGAGIALGVWAVRRMDQAREAIAPQAVASRASAHAGALGERLQQAVAAGRAAAQAREAELRSAYGIAPGGVPATGDRGVEG